jgi:hypothetical protein
MCVSDSFASRSVFLILGLVDAYGRRERQEIKLKYVLITGMFYVLTD